MGFINVPIVQNMLTYVQNYVFYDQYEVLMVQSRAKDHGNHWVLNQSTNSPVCLDE